MPKPMNFEIYSFRLLQVSWHLIWGWDIVSHPVRKLCLLLVLILFFQMPPPLPPHQRGHRWGVGACEARMDQIAFMLSGNCITSTSSEVYLPISIGVAHTKVCLPRVFNLANSMIMSNWLDPVRTCQRHKI